MDFDHEYANALRKHVNNKRIIEARLKKLRYDRDMLTDNLSELEKKMYAEEDDVILLEKKNIQNILLSLFGLMDDTLTAEKKEAYAAVLKYDTCFAELESVKEEIKKLEKEREPLAKYEVEYEKLIREKEKQITEAKESESFKRLREIEEKIALTEQRIAALDEAIAQGEYVRLIMRDLLEYLVDAEDIGMISLAKSIPNKNGTNRLIGNAAVFAQHRGLDEIHEIIKLLTIQLRKFSTMINDEIIYESNIQISRRVRIAHYLYDGMGIGVYIESKIKEGIKSARKVDIDVMVAINALMKRKEELVELIPRIERSKKQYILDVKL